jgi:hypothetical protein
MFLVVSGWWYNWNIVESVKHEVHLHLYHVSRLSNVIVYIFIISGVAYILTNEGKITDLSIIQVSGHNFLMELQRDAGNYTNASVCLFATNQWQVNDKHYQIKGETI